MIVIRIITIIIIMVVIKLRIIMNIITIVEIINNSHHHHHHHHHSNSLPQCDGTGAHTATSGYHETPKLLDFCPDPLPEQKLRKNSLSTPPKILD